MDKRAIVIGASSGIGREVAKLLLADGWKLGVAARRTELLQTLGAVEAVQIDVNADDEEQLEELTDETQLVSGYDELM